MKTANPAKSVLITGVCFVLIFIFVGTISAQKKKVGNNSSQDRDLVKPTQTDTNQPKTTTAKSSAKNETVKADTTPRKKILVVLDFDNVSIECRNDIYGKNVATQLSTAFSETGEYTVIEKQRIEDVFTSIDASQDERYDPRTAAKVGKALSANSVVLGTITECNTKSDMIGGFGVKMLTQSVKVSLAIRLVDINTGEILDAVRVSESAEDRSPSFKGKGSQTYLSPEVTVRLFNKAVQKAVSKSVGQLTSIIEGKTAPEVAKEKTSADGNAAKKNPNIPVVSKPKAVSFPKVATVVGTTVYITGLGQDAKIGDLFSVIRGVEIKDPDTGEVLDFDGSEIAKVEITEVRENTVKAKIIQGKGIKEKDVVKPIQ